MISAKSQYIGEVPVISGAAFPTTSSAPPMAEPEDADRRRGQRLAAETWIMTKRILRRWPATPRP